MATGAVLVLALALGGCRTDLLHELDEGQANQVIAALDHAGIAADKQRVARGNGASYVVTVARQDASRSWQLLRQHNLPRRSAPGLDEVFGDVGLVPTALQERALMRKAIAGELQQMLQSIAGVRDSHVNVVVPRRQPLASADAPTPKPRAAVLLKVGDRSPLSREQVQQLVSGSVEGLDPAAVSVVIDKDRAAGAAAASPTLASVGPFRVTADSRGLLVGTLIVLVVLVCALVLGVVMLLRAVRALRGAMANVRPDRLDLDSSMSLIAQSFRRGPAARTRHSAEQ